jgi:predicted nucleic acid-binding protein
LTEEAATDRVFSWLTQHGSDDLTISDWVVTEFAAALSVKIRMGQLRVEDRAKAAGLFKQLQAESLAVVPITREHFQAAARFADQSGLGLRAGDALHVAVAAELGATLCTLDKRLAEAAIALGVSAEMV